MISEKNVIRASKTPDELVDHLWALADCCNFPTDEDKERNIQFHLVLALTDGDLIKKLLTLELTASTAKMVEVCQTHITIAHNLNAMGIGSKSVKAVQKQN